jgi:hypothetical protein
MKQQSKCCPDVLINGIKLLLNKEPKPLGTTLSTHFVSTPHVHKNVMPKMNKHLQLLKAMSGQDCGDKQTLSLTYKAFIKPVLIFNAPIWYPSMDPKSISIKRLQNTQNLAMRVTTRWHLKTTSSRKLNSYLLLLS